jgi:glycosyltransferase involved in cell wall biosynthesis
LYYYKFADFVIFQSKFCQEAANIFLGNRVALSEIIYNPVDTKRFTPRSKSVSIQNNLTLLVAGSHHWLYRITLAIQSIKIILKYRPVKLKIVGSTPRHFWNAISALINALDLADYVEFYGTYTQKEAPFLFQSCNILLHLKYIDYCPSVVIEAMSCGLPVVYIDCGGVSELVGECGVGIPVPLEWDKIVLPPPEKIADSVLRIVENYNYYSESARQRVVDKFNLDKWIARHKEIFSMILDD